MPNLSISGLTAGAAVADGDLLPNVQLAGTGPVKTTAAQLKTFMSASPTLVTPVLGVASGTSLALGGATIGSNALAVTGTAAFSGTLSTTGAIIAGAAQQIYWSTRTTLQAPSNGALQVGDNALTNSFTITAGASNLASFNGAIGSANGTASLPAFGPSSDPNTGMYFDGADGIYWGTGGGQKMQLTGANLNVTPVIVAAGGIQVSSGQAFRLGNAYQAGDPTTTGYLLVTDSAGVVYRIPAMAN